MTDEVADVVVIGAGVQGTSAAFHLARRGLKVAVIERSSLASGATGASSGFIRMHYDLESEARLAWASFPWFGEWTERVGFGSPGFVQTGFVQLVEPGLAPALQRTVSMLQRLGVDTTLVTASDLRTIAPGMNVADVEVAAYEPASGYGDPSGTAQGFLAAARSLGAMYRRGTAVTGIRSSGSRVTGVSTDSGSISAPTVVLAAGAWSATVARSVGLELPVRAWREHTAYFVVPDELRGGFPAVIDAIAICSFRPEGSNLLLAGVEDANVVGVSPDSGFTPMPANVIERLANRLAHRLPLMIRGELMSSQAGQDGITPDQRPILGPAGPDGLVLSCGFSGTGFKTAPAVGLCLAEQITTGAATTVDIEPYSLARFDAGRLLVASDGYPAFWREAHEPSSPVT